MKADDGPSVWRGVGRGEELYSITQLKVAGRVAFNYCFSKRWILE